MNAITNRIGIFLAISIMLSCEGKAFQSNQPTWEGVFDLSPRGEQKAKAQFDVAKKEGVLMLPDLIPVPLNVTDLAIKGDSLFFTVGFRSGPAFCKAKMEMAKGRIEGVMDKEGLPQASFWLEMSKQPLIETTKKPSADEPLVVTSKNNSERELDVKKRLEALWEKYDLEPYTYTKKVQIESGVIPHSHPVLTLNTRFANDTLLLGTFLHEQMHWYSLTDKPGLQKAGEVLLEKYPDLPVELPEGAGSEQSTFIHLGVCYMEYHTLSKVIGEEKAKEYMQYMSTQYYRWVYRTILQDLDFFTKLFEENGLHID